MIKADPADGEQPATTEQAQDPRVLHRAIGASAIGNATEWYDYGAYAVVATYIGHHFFPGEHETLLTLATLAVSFIARPFGGFFWGPLGDRLGRKGVLAMTIIMMSAATFCIGLLPTYETIGIGAPILLIILRLIQGFSTGGEYGGAATFMAEYAPDKRRGFYAALLDWGSYMGNALGAGLVTVHRPRLSVQVQQLGTRSQPTVGSTREDRDRPGGIVRGDEVEIGSRNERPMTRYFPEVVEAVRRNFPERAVIDGEIVIIDPDRDGLDFEALQQRIHPAESRINRLAEETPAELVFFDVLAVGDEDLTSSPFADRRGRLSTMARC